jgi:hypothetical protein
MDAVHGADIDAGFVLDADTWLRDHVGHSWGLPFKRVEKNSPFGLRRTQDERGVLKVAHTWRE